MDNKKPEPKKPEEPTVDTTPAMTDGLLMKWSGLPPKFPYKRP